MAYTNGLDIDDFKTYRVNGNLELMPGLQSSVRGGLGVVI
jgi:hypothetical protein